MDADVKQIESVAIEWAGRARAITIIDQRTYDLACAMRIDIGALEKRIIAHHKPIKEATDKAHTVACAAEHKMLDPVVDAKKILNRSIGNWEQEQEIKRLQAQREAEAAQLRLEEEARLAVAVEAEQHGAEAQTVLDILNTPVPIPVAMIAPTFQRAQGVSLQERWHAEVIDIKALCRAIADCKASLEFVEPNMPVLNSMARAMKQTMNIPGVRAVPEVSVAVRRVG